jgi:hypothetical protein
MPRLKGKAATDVFKAKLLQVSAAMTATSAVLNRTLLFCAPRLWWLLIACLVDL